MDEKEKITCDDVFKEMDITLKKIVSLGVPIAGNPVTNQIDVPNTVMLQARILAETQAHILIITTVLTQLLQKADEKILSTIITNLKQIQNSIDEKKRQPSIVVPGKNTQVITDEKR